MMPTVLVVDDDRDCADALKDTLQDFGYQVSTAHSATEALRQLESAPRPAVIILDLLMPGMTGEEFLDRRRRDPRLAEIPVIVVSATPPQPPLDGYTPVLRKPVDPTELLETIASVTSSP
jgi:two-component system chemotaxis response regulator CheY